ncbi:MAG: response regulator [Acidobacteria bacterium]|nr:response regulator [Acidobacteriota bacterium]
MDTKAIILKCTHCRGEKKFSLMLGQVRSLSEGKRLQFHCSYCGTPQLWEAAERLETLTVTPDESATKVKNILVVDDDDLTLKLLQKVLSTFETHIEVAQSGREAFAKLAAQSFDLVISDIHMPGMTGPELFQHIQDNALIPAQRIIFLTGDKSPAMKEFLDRSGCSYLYKPIQFLDFSEQVQAVLAGETLD